MLFKDQCCTVPSLEDRPCTPDSIRWASSWNYAECDVRIRNNRQLTLAFVAEWPGLSLYNCTDSTAPYSSPTVYMHPLNFRRTMHAPSYIITTLLRLRCATVTPLEQALSLLLSGDSCARSALALIGRFHTCMPTKHFLFLMQCFLVSPYYIGFWLQHVLIAELYLHNNVYT